MPAGQEESAATDLFSNVNVLCHRTMSLSRIWRLSVRHFACPKGAQLAKPSATPSLLLAFSLAQAFLRLQKKGDYRSFSLAQAFYACGREDGNSPSFSRQPLQCRNEGARP
jgi:hypothetical protein